MPSTHLSLHLHIVFSTKHREARITTERRDRLHADLGGVDDHVHLLLGLTATARLADGVRDMKAVPCKRVHEEPGDRAFAWQQGDGAFTVSPSHRENVRNSIACQEEHHRKRTFQAEYLELLHRCGVDFDKRDLW